MRGGFNGMTLILLFYVTGFLATEDCEVHHLWGLDLVPLSGDFWVIKINSLPCNFRSKALFQFFHLCWSCFCSCLLALFKLWYPFPATISLTHEILQARLQVREEVLQQIRSLNSLDLELYKYALDIFAKQKQKLASIVSRHLWEIIQDAVFYLFFFFFGSLILRWYSVSSTPDKHINC